MSYKKSQPFSVHMSNWSFNLFLVLNEGQTDASKCSNSPVVWLRNSLQGTCIGFKLEFYYLFVTLDKLIPSVDSFVSNI